jgi:hypothetical protein
MLTLPRPTHDDVPAVAFLGRRTAAAVGLNLHAPGAAAAALRAAMLPSPRYRSRADTSRTLALSPVSVLPDNADSPERQREHFSPRVGYFDALIFETSSTLPVHGTLNNVTTLEVTL